MPKTTRASGYDTNLASEFYVLSCLHRIGLTANLTLGNKKGVDIGVARKAGDSVTGKVKNIAKRDDWVAKTIASPHPEILNSQNFSDGHRNGALRAEKPLRV